MAGLAWLSKLNFSQMMTQLFSIQRCRRPCSFLPFGFGCRTQIQILAILAVLTVLLPECGTSPGDGDNFFMSMGATGLELGGLKPPPTMSTTTLAPITMMPLPSSLDPVKKKEEEEKKKEDEKEEKKKKRKEKKKERKEKKKEEKKAKKEKKKEEKKKKKEEKKKTMMMTTPNPKSDEPTTMTEEPTTMKEESTTTKEEPTTTKEEKSNEEKSEEDNEARRRKAMKAGKMMGRSFAGDDEKEEETTTTKKPRIDRNMIQKMFDEEAAKYDPSRKDKVAATTTPEPETETPAAETQSPKAAKKPIDGEMIQKMFDKQAAKASADDPSSQGTTTSQPKEETPTTQETQPGTQPPMVTNPFDNDMVQGMFNKESEKYSVNGPGSLHKEGVSTTPEPESQPEKETGTTPRSEEETPYTASPETQPFIQPRSAETTPEPGGDGPSTLGQEGEETTNPVSKGKKKKKKKKGSEIDTEEVMGKVGKGDIGSLMAKTADYSAFH